VESRPAKIYKGSKQRVRRIRMRGNWSIGIWLLVILVLIDLVVVLTTR
jgi:hypothetical protein